MRVPSGKIITHMPFPIAGARADAHTWFTAGWPDLRLMGMGLMAMRAWPMSGIHMSSRLNTQDWVGKTTELRQGLPGGLVLPVGDGGFLGDILAAFDPPIDAAEVLQGPVVEMHPGDADEIAATPVEGREQRHGDGQQDGAEHVQRVEQQGAQEKHAGILMDFFEDMPDGSSEVGVDLRVGFVLQGLQPPARHHQDGAAAHGARRRQVPA